MRQHRIKRIPSSTVCTSKFSITFSVSYGQHKLQLLVDTHNTCTDTFTYEREVDIRSLFDFFILLSFFKKKKKNRYLINCSRNSVDEERRICLRFNVISAQMNKLCEIHCTLHTSPVLSTLYVIGHHNNVENVAVHYCRFSVFQ